MANPDNALGTNGAFGGRTSVNAFNDVLSAFDGRGVLSGWECAPDTGLTVTVGGVSGTRDVAIAEDPGGNKTTVNNISQEPISVTMSAAPASNSRVDAIVAYIESSPSSNAVLDNYEAVNLLMVSGTVSASPEIPNDSQIRTAITADGASGSTAYYVVLASVTIPSGTTDIDGTMITGGAHPGLLADNIGDETVGTDKLADSAVTADKIDFATIIPQSAGVEVDTGMLYGGESVYAQRFVGTFTTSTSNRVQVNLIGSGVSKVLHAIGAWAPNSQTPSTLIDSPMTSSTGGVVFDAAVMLSTVPGTGLLRFNINSGAYNGQTGSYDFVVFYTKE